MSRTRFLILIIVTAAVIVAAVLMRASRNQTGEQAEGLYFPDLLGQSNVVMKVVVNNGQQTTTIVNDDNVWTIVEKGDYPASLDKVREVVLGLARMRRVEAKTGKPELYGKLGLEGIDVAESTSTLVQLLDGSENTLAQVIIGKEKTVQGGPPRRQFYVRTPEDPQAWLVEGQMPDLGAATAWMNTSIFGSDAIEIRSIKVSREEASWTVSRESADTDVYVLEGLATDEEIDSQFAINQVARSFGDLVFEDVRPASGDGDDAREDSVVAELFDGARVTLTLRRDGDRYFGRFFADYIPAGDADKAIAAKVEGWNALWRKREYLLSDYQLENVIVARDDLIKEDVGQTTAQ